MALKRKKIETEINPRVDPSGGPNPNRPPLRPVEDHYTEHRPDRPVSERLYGEQDARQDYYKAQENVLKGSIWMVGISVALFFLPAINGLIGGLVGGYKVGGVSRALVAAILPAVVVALGLWLLLIIMGLPLIGFLAGVTVAGWIALSEIGLFVGAAIGGALSEARFGSRNRRR